jgi:hypothetical protein
MAILMEETLIAKPVISKNLRAIVGVLVLIVIAGGGYYFYHASSSTPEKTSQEETKRLVAAVGKLMVLPASEQPIIATVADPSKLTSQPFFANAKKGDKVLIYNIAHKAVLYRPDQNVIIDVAPLSIGTPAPSPK